MRTCLDCGGALPEGSSVKRKYCDECIDKHKREGWARKREAERQRKARQANYPKTVPKEPETLKKRDVAYCIKCGYHGNISEGYLCNFMLTTGERRGCPAGVGCERRKTA